MTKTTYAALGFTMVVLTNGITFKYNHKTNTITMNGLSGIRQINYDPDGEWFDIMDHFNLWK